MSFTKSQNHLSVYCATTVYVTPGSKSAAIRIVQTWQINFGKNTVGSFYAGPGCINEHP